MTLRALAVIDALNLMRDIFGEGWLASATKDWHPMPTYWMGSFTPDFTSEWLSDFSVKLQVLHRIEGFDNLLSRLRNSSEYYGAIGKFELASRMATKGYKIELRTPTTYQTLDDRILTWFNSETNSFSYST